MRFYLFSLFFASTYAKNIFTPPQLYGEERSLDCEYFTTTEADELYACKVTKGFGYTIASVINASNHVEISKTNEDVQVLIFEDVEMALLPSGIATVFPNLIGLIISNTGLRHLRKTDLASFTKLKYISVTKTEIRVLEKDLFKANTELIFVDLSNNLISYIHKNAFDVTTQQIKKLLIEPLVCDFDAKNAETPSSTLLLIESLQESCSPVFWLENSYTSVVKDFIENMEKLITDSTTTTTITESDPTTIESDSSSSTSISITTESQCDTKDLDDKILKLESDIKKLQSNFSNCQNDKNSLEDENKHLSEELDEAKNPVNGTCRFKNIDGVYGCSANQLTIKTASDQKFTWTGTHVDSNLNSDVKIISIKNRIVLLFPLEIGTNFQNIQTLIFESSGLQKLTKNDFKTLEKLIKLSIIGNKILSIESGTFDILTKLSILDLSKNELPTLPSKAFDKLVQLNSLNLNDNRFTQLRYDMVPATNKIIAFNAKNNKLIAIDIFLVWRINSASIIDFTGNTCNMKFDKSEGLSFKNDFFNKIVKECT